MKKIHETIKNKGNNEYIYFNDRFLRGEPRLTGFIEAKDDGSGGDNWSYKSFNAPVKSSPPTTVLLKKERCRCLWLGSERHLRKTEMLSK